MENDIRKEARVWQRIQSEKQDQDAVSGRDHLPALIMEQLQLSSAYMQLSRLLQGKDGTEFVRLAREARGQAACLKGILTLVSGNAQQISTTPVSFSAVDTLLRNCYGKQLRLLREYENRSADPEYGPVFERLAQRGREHCCALLELIGKVGKGR